MKKILFCDLDGTLLDNENNIDEFTLKKLKNYIKDGGKLVIATGRLDHDIKVVEEKLGIAGEYRISQNGAVIKDKNDNVILNNTIPKDIVLDIRDYLETIDLRVEASNLTNRYFKSERPNGEVAEFVDSSIIDKHYLDKIGNEINPNIFLIFGDEEKFKPIKENIDLNFSNKVECIMTSPSSLEIFNKESSKGKAIRYILEKEDLKIDDVIACGDSDNDVSMFEELNISAALSHSKEIVRQKASHVVESVGDCIESLCY